MNAFIVNSKAQVRIILQMKAICLKWE